jgi:hypothetical protein
MTVVQRENFSWTCHDANSEVADIRFSKLESAGRLHVSAKDRDERDTARRRLAMNVFCHIC